MITFPNNKHCLKQNTLINFHAYVLLFAFQAVQDLETLLSARKIALKKAQHFLVKFQQEMAQLPMKQTIPEMPQIEWDKYKIPSVSQVSKKPETRFRGSSRKSSTDDQKEKVDGILDCKVERNSKGQFLVRGRVFDQSKPQTFNQPWTGEEQKRLEELLEEYPSEEVEMERWKKIATCLGNRTPIQVILLLVTSATYCHILVFFKDNSAVLEYIIMHKR